MATTAVVTSATEDAANKRVLTYELSIFNAVLSNYLDKPLSQTDLLAVITKGRTDGNQITGKYDTQPVDVAGTWVWNTGYSNLRRIASTEWDLKFNTIGTSANAEAKATATGFPLTHPNFVTTLIADLVVATTVADAWKGVTTANMGKFINDQVSYRLALRNYVGVTGGNFNASVLKFQKSFMSNTYFEWTVQQDLKTLTAIDLDSTADDTKTSQAAEWQVLKYARHPIQHWSVIEMTCVLQTLRDINADVFSIMVRDTIDSIAL